MKHTSQKLKQTTSTIFLLLISIGFFGQETTKTYCNPINLDYTYMIYNAHKDLSYRSGADPAVVRFKDEYYMFVTRSMGYWHSEDMDEWEFIRPKQWYFQGSNAPAAHNYKDSVLYMAGNPSGSMSVLYSENPKSGEWSATPSILHRLQDPALFIDDDDQGYIYWGSSNKFPIRAEKLDKNKKFRPSNEIHELFNLEPEKHGWERFGENHRDTILSGYIEGPWMNKFNNKYYLQYGAPGTEFDVYGDGVYIGDSPLGPFEYAPNNPFSYKPGGFINGAGHGSTVNGPDDQLWHFSSMAVNVNVGWERRVGMFPTYLDADGLLYSNTRFGDYPHYAPSTKDKKGKFTGWMVLSYKKPVKASSQSEEYPASHLVDENVKTFWLAENTNDTQWVEIDLEKPMEVRAVQINYNDYKSDMYGKIPGLYHQYTVEASSNGKDWKTIVDQSRNKRDVPNDYVALNNPEKARYIRYQNIHVPTPHLSISDIRVFGNGFGKAPKSVKQLVVERHDKRRGALVTWDAVKGAQGYNVLWGIAPDKLYSSWLVYDKTDLEIKSLNTDQKYYFSVEAFNENGVSEQSKIEIIE
ncbi:family 43 glycosylhydrolase [Flagellimonas sp. HMM57]|uniref:family 43 glycosylhydrolase n=1 Tax=unclassified Flagellimonas TaxID=2644544 RepID=UPI0013D04E4F|nr:MULTISPECIES: family 43 glycosylhydrolase [unclassified Flagellimonas]UII77217.1 family 43 glycosylhydrolase [Flagellimonas sp. HMM57]